MTCIINPTQYLRQLPKELEFNEFLINKNTLNRHSCGGRELYKGNRFPFSRETLDSASSAE